MLFALISLYGLLSNKDGWFYRSNNDLQADARLSQNLVKATLDTLYRAGIINIQCPGKGKKHTTNRIHINFESFKRYEAYSFNDIRNNPDLLIDTIPYRDHFVPSYCENIGKSESETPSEEVCENMTTIIDTIDSSNTINTSYTIENNILNNINTETEIETSTLPDRLETPAENTSSTFGDYLQGFIDSYSYINYSYSPDVFCSTYYLELTELQSHVSEGVGIFLNIKDLSVHLHYFKTTGKVLE